MLGRVMKRRGWGRCFGITERPLRGGKVYVAELKGTPLSHERRTAEASCHLLRGVVAGWFEKYCERRAVESIETECTAIGDRACGI